MEKSFTLTDIGNALAKAMDSPAMDLLSSGVIGTLGAVNPVLGVMSEVGYSLLSKYNDFRLSLLLHGLSKGANIEKNLNELYSYVTASSENALRVSNLFKQTMNAESPRACVIYGLVLANHTSTKTKPSYEEMIVCKALENATDYDLDNFKEIMDHFVVEKEGEKRVVFPNDLEKEAEFTLTCEWCEYNRLFKHGEQEWIDSLGDGNITVDTPYYIDRTAYVLLQYINAAHQIWSY